MKNTILMFILFALITAGAAAQTVAGRHQVELEDPAGDVQDNKGKPGKDVVKFSMNSDGENLNIAVELKETVEFYLKDQLAGPVIEMHFNSDNNDKTGGIAFWGNKKGFEYQLDVVACIQYEGGGLACLGSLGDKIEGYISSWKINQYAQDKKMPENIVSALENTQTPITGRRIEVTVPYAAVGLKSGSRARISIRESDSSFDDASYFPQVFFIVK